MKRKDKSQCLLTKMELNKIHNMDCLEGMKSLPDKGINMVLCDLPYGITSCEWDCIIPLDRLWEQYVRIIKDDGVILLFGTQPFLSRIIMSNLKMFRYCWVWNKKKAGNIFLGKFQPMRIHEEIAVFSKATHKYFPQMIDRPNIKRSRNYGTGDIWGGDGQAEDTVYSYDKTYPVSIIEYSNASQKGKGHPTQKPVELLKYLIKTYTQDGDIILDNCMGSGSTAVACRHLGRRFIGFEISEEYIEFAESRLAQKSLLEI